MDERCLQEIEAVLVTATAAEAAAVAFSALARLGELDAPDELAASIASGFQIAPEFFENSIIGLGSALRALRSDAGQAARGRT